MKHLASFILWAICIFISLHGPAQSSEQQKKSPILKYDFISLLGDQVSNSMGIQLGLEIPFKTNSSFEADIMYIFPCKSCGQAYTTVKTEKTSGFMVFAEYRFYLFPGKYPTTGFHLGPQIMFQYTKSAFDETNINRIPNEYHVYRNLFAIHALAGYQLKISGPLYFDPAIGLGTRYISSRNENKMEPDPGQHEYPYDKVYDSGAKWFPSITVNIKIALKL